MRERAGAKGSDCRYGRKRCPPPMSKSNDALREQEHVSSTTSILPRPVEDSRPAGQRQGTTNGHPYPSTAPARSCHA